MLLDAMRTKSYQRDEPLKLSKKAISLILCCGKERFSERVVMMSFVDYKRHGSPA